MSLARMVSAQTHPGESKQDLLSAIARKRSFDILVSDPLVLGSGAFDIQQLDDGIILKVTDHTKRNWMVFLERSPTGIVAREE
jgi:hypothetical protein